MVLVNQLYKLLSIRNRLNDSVLLGLTGGLAGTIVMDIANVILLRLKVSEALYGHLVGSMLMPTWKTRVSKKNFALGQIFHMASGALMGIPIVWILKKTGRDYYRIKGIMSGFLTWGIFHDLGIRMGIFRLKPGTIRSYYSTLIQNLLFSLTAVQTIIALADPSMFPNKSAQASVNAAQATQPLATNQSSQFKTPKNGDDANGPINKENSSFEDDEDDSIYF